MCDLDKTAMKILYLCTMLISVLYLLPCLVSLLWLLSFLFRVKVFFKSYCAKMSICACYPYIVTFDANVGGTPIMASGLVMVQMPYLLLQCRRLLLDLFKECNLIFCPYWYFCTKWQRYPKIAIHPDDVCFC